MYITLYLYTQFKAFHIINKTTFIVAVACILTPEEKQDQIEL